MERERKGGSLIPPLSLPLNHARACFRLSQFSCDTKKTFAEKEKAIELHQKWLNRDAWLFKKVYNLYIQPGR